MMSDCRTFGYAPEAREFLSTVMGNGCRGGGAGRGVGVSEVQVLDLLSLDSLILTCLAETV